MLPLKLGMLAHGKTAAHSKNGRRNPLVAKAALGDDSDSDRGDSAKAGTFSEVIDSFNEDISPSTRGDVRGKPATSQPELKKKPPITLRGNLSTQQSTRKQSAQVDSIDPDIYDYDAAFDAMHAQDAAKKAAERADAQNRRPRYMTNLLEAADVRKRDQLRAKEKLLQREREAEGDEFADKDKFVTGAYKRQQEESRKLEEAEKKKEAEEERRRKVAGMQGFYKNIMDVEEKRHQEAMEAARKGPIGSPRHSPLPADQDEPNIEAPLVEEAKKVGSNIVVNDDGQIVDKRQLLTAGLNVTAIPSATSSGKAPLRVPRGVSGSIGGKTRNQRATRERQSKMLEEQLEQAAKRSADQEAENRTNLEHVSKSRKTNDEISSARARYLQRKKEAATSEGS